MAEPLTLFAALLAGLAGSAHCLAMCGGIAGALGGASTRPRRSALVLSAGRLTGYALAGAVAGGVGAAVAFGVAGHHAVPWLRIGFGVLLVMIGLRTLTGWRGPRFIEAGGAKLWMRIAPTAGKLARKDGVLPSFGLGVLWGWLPCGLVYAMLAASVLSGGAVEGAAVMAAFGLGTVPAVAGVVLLAGKAGGWVRSGAWRKAAGVMLVVFGVWTAAIAVH